MSCLVSRENENIKDESSGCFLSFQFGTNMSVHHQFLTQLLLLITEPNSLEINQSFSLGATELWVFVFKNLCSVPFYALVESSARHKVCFGNLHQQLLRRKCRRDKNVKHTPPYRLGGPILALCTS